MDYSKGMTASFSLRKVDRESWEDLDEIKMISASIDHTADGLLESASAELKEYAGEDYYRIYMDATQGGESIHLPIFTGIASSPSRNIEGQKETYPVSFYSVLVPARDILLERGWYAPTGLSGGAIVRRLLEVCDAPIVISDNSPKLAESIIASDGETNLSMAELIVSAMNWRMRIGGDGTIYVEPKQASESATFDEIQNDLVGISVTESFDYFSCPNVFRAISGDSVAIARDDKASSIYSTVSRKREIWAEETSVTLSDGELLASYAERRLKELQTAAKSLSYSRRYVPGIGIGDIIRLNYPCSGITGTYKITSQNLELGAGITVTEESEEVWL